MSDKFDNVPVDDDTKIIFSQELNFGEYDVLYQKWSWDGVSAESIVFVNDDVVELNDSELEKEIKSSPIVNSDSSITIKRTDDGFTFVNFNFITE